MLTIILAWEVKGDANEEAEEFNDADIKNDLDEVAEAAAVIDG